MQGGVLKKTKPKQACLLLCRAAAEATGCGTLSKASLFSRSFEGLNPRKDPRKKAVS